MVMCGMGIDAAAAAGATVTMATTGADHAAARNRPLRERAGRVSASPWWEFLWSTGEG